MADGVESEELVLHRFVSSAQNSRLEEILYLDAGVELTKEGLSSTRVAGGHRYVLVSEYTTSANTVKLHYKLFAADAPSKLLAANSL